MAEVIGVRFKEVGKVYYFDPLDNKLSAGDMVIVEVLSAVRLPHRIKPFLMKSLRIRSSRLSELQPKMTFVTLRKTNLRRRRHTEFASRKLQTTNLK